MKLAADRRTIVYKIALDTLLWAVATPLAFWLRFDNTIPAAFRGTALRVTGLMLVLKLLGVFGFSLHYQVWRKVSFRDLLRLARAVASVTVVGAGLLWLWPLGPVPRSIPLLDGLLSLFLLASVRIVDRCVYQRRQLVQLNASAQAGQRRVLIVGAGEAGSMIVRELQRHPETGLMPLGLLDDDPAKQGLRLNEVPVLGKIEALEQTLRDYPVDELLIAIPSAQGTLVRHVVERAQQVHKGLRCRIIPGVYELLGEQVSVERLRKVKLEDLLRREPVRLDDRQIAAYLHHKVVLITGAGGSIGSELVRQVTRFKPAALILLGRGENSIYQLERELTQRWPALAYHCVIADVRDRGRVAQVFEHYQPQVVFHAAAHKHVPLMEANPQEAILNNVIGTRNVVELALERGVERLINISTDKAVNPSSVMGASKRLA